MLNRKIEIKSNHHMCIVDENRMPLLICRYPVEQREAQNITYIYETWARVLKIKGQLLRENNGPVITEVAIEWIPKTAKLKPVKGGSVDLQNSVNQ